MKKTCRSLLCCLFFFVLTSPAWAQHSGPYLGVFVGGQLLSPAESEDSLGTFNLEYRPAPSASVVLGWELEPGSNIGEGRVELEYTRRSNRLDEAEFSEGKVTADGDLTVDSLLINTFGVYRSASRLTPYFGAGIGVARITAEDLTVTGQPLIDDDALVLAYQLGAGFEVELTQSLTLDLGYRLFSSTKAKFTEPNGDEVKTEYLSHSAMVGLRLGF
jgi:opacity protein-like surface antigen